MMDATTNTVVITRTFDAPVERVWAAWTEPDLIKAWWGPTGFTAPHIQLDLRVGGTYLYAMHGPVGTEFDTDMWSTGTFQEIIPLRKIVSTDSFADEHGNIVPASEYGMDDFPLELHVTVEFEALADNKTKLTLTHVGAPTGEHASNMKQGWNQSLDKLAESLR